MMNTMHKSAWKRIAGFVSFRTEMTGTYPTESFLSRHGKQPPAAFGLCAVSHVLCAACPRVQCERLARESEFSISSEPYAEF